MKNNNKVILNLTDQNTSKHYSTGTKASIESR